MRCVSQEHLTVGGTSLPDAKRWRRPQPRCSKADFGLHVASIFGAVPPESSGAALVAEIRRGLSALERGRAKLYTLDALLED